MCLCLNTIFIVVVLDVAIVNVSVSVSVIFYWSLYYHYNYHHQQFLLSTISIYYYYLFIILTWFSITNTMRSVVTFGSCYCYYCCCCYHWPFWSTIIPTPTFSSSPYTTHSPTHLLSLTVYFLSLISIATSFSKQSITNLFNLLIIISSISQSITKSASSLIICSLVNSRDTTTTFIVLSIKSWSAFWVVCYCYCFGYYLLFY